MKYLENSATSNSKENAKLDAKRHSAMMASTDESPQEMQKQTHLMKTSSSPMACLAGLPNDLQGEIAGFMSAKELMRLMMTSKTLFNDSKLIKRMIKNIKQSYAIKQIAPGTRHTLALTQEGRVLVWGYNYYGQLGLGNNENQYTPQWIHDLNNVVQLAAGICHTLALTHDGSVFAWGDNDIGQLGLGHHNNQNTPQKIEGLNNVVQLAAGDDHTLALTKEGRVFAWGNNYSGQLGLGHNNGQNTPKRIEGLNNVVKLIAGSWHTLALTKEGRVWAWGRMTTANLAWGIITIKTHRKGLMVYIMWCSL